MYKIINKQSKKNYSLISAAICSSALIAGCSSIVETESLAQREPDKYLIKTEQSELFEGSRPNVVILFADDMGYGDLSCYGNNTYSTPNLDKMAEEGMKFNQFYVAQPVSGASRTGLLTGNYPNRLGMHGAPDHNATHGINPNEWTMAEMFKDAGYSTAMAGKWHLGHLKPFLPLQNGFQQYYGTPYSNDMWPFHAANPGYYPPLPLLSGNEAVEYNSDQSRFTADFTAWSKKFISDNRDNPFFLYLAYPMPHVPIFASDSFLGKSGAGLYGDVIQEIDWSVGQILSHLKELGLDEDTLVVFTSDNGPWRVYGNHAGSTGGLKGTKGTVYEGGVRVPCIARMPGKVPAGSVFDKAAMTIDLMPAFAQMIGGRVPRWGFDGVSMLPALTGESAAQVQENYAFYYGRNELQAVLHGSYKYYVPHVVRTISSYGKDGKQGTYVYPRCDYELYDLSKDQNETENLYDRAEYSKIVEDLEKIYAGFEADMGNALNGVKGTKKRRAARAFKNMDGEVIRIKTFDSDYTDY